MRKTVDSEIPVVRRLAEHISSGGGKRLRPALVLLASQFCGYDSDEDIRYAAVFELIHTATLIHDDIIDHAAIRRGNPTLNAKWGNALSVLFGDFIAIKATRTALAGRNQDITEVIVDAAISMIEGELIQNECVFSLETSRDTYFEIIQRKTGFLFAACAECGAILGGKDKAFRQSLSRFGMEFGTAFQLVDDLLDFVSTSDQLGKPVFSDLHEGKLTLPLIALLEKAPSVAAPLIERIWANGPSAISERDTQKLMELMEQYGTLDEARELAKLASNDAISSLPANIGGDADIAKLLQEAPKIMLERTR